MGESSSSFELPGFRFHPTDEELLEFYLKKMVFGQNSNLRIIDFLNIYRYDPWDLPGKAKIGEREWYFFVPRDRKHGNGGRPNRTTEHGFWKATGSDRDIFSLTNPKRLIGLRKTLVFYQGRAPRANKTNWVMNEYRLPDKCSYPRDIVLCKIYMKATSLKALELEARAAMEETKSTLPNSPHSSNDVVSNPFSGQLEDLVQSSSTSHVALKNEVEDKLEDTCKLVPTRSSTLKLPAGEVSLPQLQLPSCGNMEWAQEPFSAQILSPWLENLLNLSSPTVRLH